MPSPSHRRPIVALALAVALAAGAGAGCTSPGTLRPFTTDGCSLFPDRDPLGRADWRACCVTHDIAYWKGGTEQERLDADRALRECVAKTTGEPLLAETMYVGVRGGGQPVFPTWYRWGYGWSYGRKSEPLTAEERRQAEAELARWRTAQGTDARAAPPAR